MDKFTVEYYEGVGDYDMYHGAIKGIDTDYYYGKHVVVLYELTFEEGMDHWTPTGKLIYVPFQDFVKYFKEGGSTFLN